MDKILILLEGDKYSTWKSHAYRRVDLNGIKYRIAVRNSFRIVWKNAHSDLKGSDEKLMQMHNAHFETPAER